MFDLKLVPPQNFAAYRQAELDNNRIGTYTQIVLFLIFLIVLHYADFLGMTEEEIAENERLWREENDENLQVLAMQKAVQKCEVQELAVQT